MAGKAFVTFTLKSLFFRLSLAHHLTCLLSTYYVPGTGNIKEN